MATSTVHPNHALISSEDVEGTNVYDMKGSKIGEIDHLMIDKISGRVTSYGQKIRTAEEPVLHRAIELAGAQSWGDGYQSGFRDFPDLPIASRRIGVPRLNLWVWDHAAS